MNPPATLQTVCSVFSLSEFERDILLLCVGVELDSRFAGLVAAIQGDARSTSPTFTWDNGNDYFPPTSFQVVDVRAGIGAPNVTPADLSARFNFRYSTEWTHDSLKKKVESVFDAHDIDYEISEADYWS